jgi:hypothetical protein
MPTTLPIPMYNFASSPLARAPCMHFSRAAGELTLGGFIRVRTVWEPANKSE